MSTPTAPTSKQSARSRQECYRTTQQSWCLRRDPMSPFAATITAQRGRQTEFLRSPADICIYGGAAGGGKTVGLILEPLRYATRVANFTTVFFRRSTPQITDPGGLWDESQNFYPRLGGMPHVGMREWRWPRRQDQVLASAVRQHGLCLARRADRADLFRRVDAFHRASVLLHGQPQPLDLRRAPPATPMPTAGSPTSWGGGSTRRTG